MTVRVNGMTISEIEAKFKEFDVQKKEARRKYKAGEIRIIPEPLFTPDAEYDFVHKLHKPLEKACKELAARLNKTKTDEEKAELFKIQDRILKLLTRCDDIEKEIMFTRI